MLDRRRPARQTGEMPVESERLLQLAGLVACEGAIAMHGLAPLPGTTEERAALYQLAEEEHVAPLLYVSLRRRGHLDLLPKQERDLLRRRYQYNLLRNERLKAEAEALARDLNRAGIVPILLKGGVALFDDYVGDGTRVMADLDLFVPRQQYETALRIASESGYRPDDVDHEWTFQSKPLRRSDSPGAVEIHYFVGEQRHFISPDDALAAAVILPAPDVRMMALAPTHRVLHNVIHSEIQDRGHELRRLALRQLHDLAGLVRRYRGEIDWHWIVERMGQQGMLDVLAARIDTAHRLLGMDYPDGLPRAGMDHLARCLAVADSPRQRRALAMWAGATAPLTSLHLDLLYDCGIAGPRLHLRRMRHIARLLLRHRRRVGKKVIDASHRFG